MLFVLLATHTPETCPLANSKTRELVLNTTPELPNMAKKHGVKFVAGPLVNREHVVVAIVEAEKAEAVDEFLSDSRLAHWNSVRVIPSVPIAEGLKEVERVKPIF